MQIQKYLSAYADIGAPVDLQFIIDTIKGRTGDSALLQQQIERIRTVAYVIKQEKKNDPVNEELIKQYQDEYDELKKSLPAVTWSGTFTGRKIEKLKVYTNLIVADIDKEVITGYIKTPEGKRKAVKEAQFKNDADFINFVEAIKKDPHTRVGFISPSGEGVKAVFRVGGGVEHIKDNFLSIENYVKTKYGKVIDKSGKDVTRLCFMTVDFNLWENVNPVVLPCVVPIPEKEINKLSKLSPKEKQTLQASGQEVNDVWESTQMYFEYTEGNRNNFIFKFACNCNRVGIEKWNCLAFAEAAAHDMKREEIKASVNSAYNHNANEYGKFKRKKKGGEWNKLPGNNSAAGNGSTFKRPYGDDVTYTASKTAEPPYIFWKTHHTEKGRGEKKYTVSRLELSRVDFRKFLNEQGFHLLATGDEEGFQIVHSADGIIKPISPQQIKHYALNWCQEYNLKEVEEMLLKGQTKYFAKNELDSLPYREVTLKRDTFEYSYFYFRNCYLRVNRSGDIEQLPYDNVEGYIWESNKIKHDYQDADITILDASNQLLPYERINCEFARFIAFCSYNPNNEEESHFSRAVITQRFFAFCSAIGWLLDGYKHPSKRTSIFAVDHKIGDRNEANGRTGKSMIPQACAKLKKVANISGKNYDPKYQFCDEPITVDTQIVNFNDMQRNFDVENIFEKIADPYSVNRRNQGFIFFDYATSPKIYYSTNFTPKGDGESYKSRMTVIEFTDYFNSGHTPYDEFGHGFFDDSWTPEEWQRFYNFMVWCVSYYKENGLVDYPHPNMEARKLINDVVPEFIDFMEDPDFVPKNTRLEKILLQEKFNERYQQLYNKKLTAHTFTAWVKKFCLTKGYRLNPKQNGKHDKSNSKEYLTIADEHYKPEQQTLL